VKNDISIPPALISRVSKLLIGPMNSPQHSVSEEAKPKEEVPSSTLPEPRPSTPFGGRVQLIVRKNTGGYFRMRFNVPDHLTTSREIADYIYESWKTHGAPCAQCGILTTRTHDATILLKDEALVIFYPCCMSPGCTLTSLAELQHIASILKTTTAEKNITRITQCTGCGKKSTAEEKFMVCSGCKFSRYCSAECQKKDWPAHKLFCKKSAH